MERSNSKDNREEEMTNLQNRETELAQKLAVTNAELSRIKNESIRVQEAAQRTLAPVPESSRRPDGPYAKDTLITRELRSRVLNDEYNTDLGVQLGILQTSWRIDRFIDKQEKTKTGKSLAVPQGRLAKQRMIPEVPATYEGLQIAQVLVQTRIASLKITKDELEQNLSEVRERLRSFREEQQAGSGS
jgi:hypothetical protein